VLVFIFLMPRANSKFEFQFSIICKRKISEKAECMDYIDLVKLSRGDSKDTYFQTQSSTRSARIFQNMLNRVTAVLS
jgi:hypothetical protein